MLKEDYIMRLIQLFNESLGKWLSKKKDEDTDLTVSFNNELVEPYLGENIESFESKTSEELITQFKQIYTDKQERLSRFEILAEVLYQRAFLEENSDRGKSLLSKSLEILLYINSIDRTYSIARESRIKELRLF
ncbi:MAG: hypothetical protein ACYC2P_11900 [Paludibacteraceae bacterium]